MLGRLVVRWRETRAEALRAAIRRAAHRREVAMSDPKPCGLEPPEGYEPDDVTIGLLAGPEESAGEPPAYDDEETS